MDKNSWKRFDKPFIPTIPGTWRSHCTANADLVTLGDRYFLYYRGGDQYHDRIGVMTCPVEKFDGFTWEDYPGNPVIDVGRENEFDGVNTMDPSATVFNGKVYLYYSAFGEKAETIGLAVSENGFHFEKWSSNPVLIGRCPQMIVHDGKCYLFFVRKNPLGGYSVHCALSGDGVRFDALYKPVLEPGDADSWESKSVTTPRVFKEGDTFYMVYAADNKTIDGSSRFGLAVSTDLLKWEKYGANPIFETSSAGAWDDGHMWFGSVKKINGKYWMWYEACNRRRGYPDFISAVGVAMLDAPWFFVKPGTDPEGARE
jgi:predicted GH43/DUF377 family glycosyl hydrolase